MDSDFRYSNALNNSKKEKGKGNRESFDADERGFGDRRHREEEVRNAWRQQRGRGDRRGGDRA